MEAAMEAEMAVVTAEMEVTEAEMEVMVVARVMAQAVMEPEMALVMV